MEFINFHIAYLLTQHECVIIPDFGAFVVSKIQDDKSKKRGFISPPVNHSLTFNPEIIHDDGLLVHSIAKEKNIGDTEALRLVNEYVDNLVDALRTGQPAQFPWIGKIHLSGDRKIVFTPAKNLSCNASNCGLANLNFPCLNEVIESEFEKKQKKIYKRPLFYIILAAIFLILTLVFLFGFNPLNKNFLSFSNVPIENDTIIENSIKPAIDTLPTVSIDFVKPVKTDSAALSPEYFIIISSFTTEKEAGVMLDYFLAKGLEKAEIIRSDGKFRIFIEKFAEKEEALSFLDMLKKDGKNSLFKDAWIFENKTDSLNAQTFH